VRERLIDENAAGILRGAHLVIDGTDTFETRQAVAHASEELGIPLVWGTVQGFDAQITVFWNRPPAGAAPVVLDDLYPAGSVGEVPTCADVGVLGALCLQVGAVLATEAIKLVTGVGESLLGRVLVIDGLRARQYEVPLRAATTHAAPASPAPSGRRELPHVGPAGIDGALLLDVREHDEVARGMIPGSLHVPLAELLADPSVVPPAERVVVVCQAGVRARHAVEVLRATGVDAAVLAGGIEAWEAAGSALVPA
jgi:adenylyltransferase/sulfurtransferase